MKKFKDTKVGALLGKVANSELLEKAADAFTGGAFSTVKDLITGDSNLTPENKELALKELEVDIEEMANHTRRWEVDMKSDSTLAKNVRPMMLVSLLCAIISFTFLDAYANGWKVRDIWIDLYKYAFMVALGGYFSGRTVEKWKGK
jgi:hypothetical protein